MFSVINLFQERLREHIKEVNRYMRYILNGHTAIALVFLVSVLSVYYQAWLKDLPPNFPAAIIISIIFGVLASWTPINTLLKEPDVVFLIASEHKMNAYFCFALMYSYIAHLYLVLLIFVALGPLYFQVFLERNIKDYLLILFILLVIKGLNLVTRFMLLKVQNKQIHTYSQFTQVFITIALFLTLLNNHFFITALITLILFAFFLFSYYWTSNRFGFNWELLIENDRNRKKLFYRLASQFVNVPHIKSRIKRRRLFTSFVNKRIIFSQESVYDYLYRLTFLRVDDYIYMYIRLIIIGGLFIYFIPNVWLKLALGLLFIYMSNFQLISLFHHHRLIVWLDLYPIYLDVRIQSFISLLIRLTFIQTIVFTMIFMFSFNFLFSLIMFTIGSIFNYLFNKYYVLQKVKDPTPL